MKNINEKKITKEKILKLLDNVKTNLSITVSSLTTILPLTTITDMIYNNHNIYQSVNSPLNYSILTAIIISIVVYGYSVIGSEGVKFFERKEKNKKNLEELKKNMNGESEIEYTY